MSTCAVLEFAPFAPAPIDILSNRSVTTYPTKSNLFAGLTTITIIALKCYIMPFVTLVMLALFLCRSYFLTFLFRSLSYFCLSNYRLIPNKIFLFFFNLSLSDDCLFSIYIFLFLYQISHISLEFFVLRSNNVFKNIWELEFFLVTREINDNI